jgi:alpha-tubulin suppressor-like RCC1 family protein
MKHSSTFRISPPVNHPILRIFLFAVLLVGISLPLAAQSEAEEMEVISYNDLRAGKLMFRPLGSPPLQLPSTTPGGAAITYDLIRGASVLLAGNILTLRGTSGIVTIKASQNEGDVWPLADGSYITLTVEAPSLWKKLHVGRNSIGSWSAALKEDGTLWAWGSGATASLGVDGLFFRRRPAQSGSDNDWADLFGYVSNPLFAAIKTNGRMYTWGNNVNGQLGLGHTDQVRVPTAVDSATDWKMAACGNGFILALKTDGTLWATGYNTSGQLGLGNQTTRLTFARIGTDSNWISVTTGTNSSYALKSDGSLWAWGGNGEGRLGDGTITNRLQPVRIGLDTDWKFIQAGDTHCVGLKNNGTLWAWGRNTLGQLGNGTFTDAVTPTLIQPSKRWKFLTAGRDTTSAIDTNGVLWTWGSNRSNQLGMVGVEAQPTPFQVNEETDWAQIACSDHTIAIKNDGTLWSWGVDHDGELGNTSWWPQPMRADHTLKVVSCSSNLDFSAFILEDGSLWTSGINANGQLGIGVSSKFLERTAKQVGTTYDWQTVSVGGRHALALKKDGTLWTWGNNDFGQIGNNILSNALSPVAIIPTQKWKKIHAGFNHSVAIADDNTLWAWGDGSYGQLGRGNTSSSYVPVKIGTHSDWVDIAAYNHTLALKSDGSLWAWGENLVGQLGLGHELPQLAPVQVGSSKDWKKTSAGHKHSAAIREDGSLWTWGGNTWGELGYAQQTLNNTPKKVGQDTDWSDVTAGYQFTAAIKIGGALWTSGSNFRGGAMQGSSTYRNRYTFWEILRVGDSSAYASLATGGIKSNIAMMLTATGDLWSGASAYSGAFGNIRVSPKPRRILSGLSQQKIVVAAPTQVSSTGGPTSLYVRAESGLPVEYSVKGDATISQNQITVTGSYPITVVAWQKGDHVWDIAEPVVIPIFMPEIVVEKADGSDFINNVTALTFSSIEAKQEAQESLQIRNIGTSELSISSIKIEGLNTDEFLINHTGPLTISAGESTSIQVTFKPRNDLTGSRTATLKILSDDVDEATFAIALSAMAYSNNRDADADGLHDWAEYKLASLGFDWQSADPEKVALLGEAQLYTEGQLETIHAGKFLMKRDPETQDFHVSFTLQKSSNLTGWTPQPVTLPSLEVDAEGRIHFRFQSTGSSSFLRFVVD